jgi:hypothetical protein
MQSAHEAATHDLNLTPLLCWLPTPTPTPTQVIREATIRWAMVDQLSKPPAEFAPVIQAHFKHRGPYILNQIDGWIGEATESGHKGRLQALKGQLEAELAKLQ